jgi:diacylglycerol kinase family enzyme
VLRPDKLPFEDDDTLEGQMLEPIFDIEEQPQSDQDTHIDTIAAIFNPTSVDAQRAMSFLRAATDKPLVEIHSVKGGAEPNSEVIQRHAEQLGRHTLLTVVGGDGMAHVATNAMAIAGRQTPALLETKRFFINGGTAGDTARALNGMHMLHRLDSVLEHGWFEAIYPMQNTLTFPDGTVQSTLALSYNSVGSFTGLAAEYINAPEHRERWLNRYRATKRVAQGLTGLRALKHAQLVELSIDGEDSHQTSDIHCLSGPVMATLDHSSTELTEPGFHIVENKRQTIPYLLTRAVRLGYGNLISRDAPLTTDVSIKTHTPTLFQADGETWRIPAGTTIDVSTGDPFYALTTRSELREHGSR